ncbi:MAG TPA: hypothetical protein VH989_12305 [Actinomycetota bacterium]
MKARSIAAALVLSILAAACANSSAAPGAGSTGGGLPAHSDQLVLRMDTSGGFVAPSFSQGQIPGFSLYADGRVITLGAQIEIYPQPALPPVMVSRVDAAGVQAILQAALAAGLGTDADYVDLGSTMIADAPTTTFTLTADGQTHVVRVYALGELGSKPEQMTQDEFDARIALLDLSTKLGDLRTFVGADDVTDDGAYVTHEMRVWVDTYQPDETLQEPGVAWPGSSPLAEFGSVSQTYGTRCGTVMGDELSALLPLAEQANQLTPWKSDGERFGLVFRPLLPDESGC